MLCVTVSFRSSQLKIYVTAGGTLRIFVDGMTRNVNAFQSELLKCRRLVTGLPLRNNVTGIHFQVKSYSIKDMTLLSRNET